MADQHQSKARQACEHAKAAYQAELKIFATAKAKLVSVRGEYEKHRDSIKETLAAEKEQLKAQKAAEREKVKVAKAAEREKARAAKETAKQAA